MSDPINVLFFSICVAMLVLALLCRTNVYNRYVAWIGDQLRKLGL